MSGKYGTCISCNKYVMGIYTLEVGRGFVDDKYEFNLEICESCLDKSISLLSSKWDMTRVKERGMVDYVHLYTHREALLDEILVKLSKCKTITEAQELTVDLVLGNVKKFPRYSQQYNIELGCNKCKKIFWVEEKDREKISICPFCRK